MKYESRKLSEIEFPVYFSLFSRPGYDISKLKTFGINGEWHLFFGNPRQDNVTTNLEWGNTTDSIGGKV